MPTLVIHAPYPEVQQYQKQSFQQTVTTEHGGNYANTERTSEQ